MKYHFVLKGGAISIDLNITHEQAADIIHSFVLSVPDEEEATEQDLGASIEALVADDKPAKKYKKHKKERKTSTCSNCGKQGHLKTTCPDDNEPEEPESEPLTEYEYGSVVDLKKDGLTSKDISDQLELSRREVNFAYSSTLFENYLQSRK